jgi:hypothetical protein
MMKILDLEARGTMIFAWWMACICDAYASAYYRRKPVLDNDDYDIDFYTLDPIDELHGPMPSPREQLEVNYDAYMLFSYLIDIIAVYSEALEPLFRCHI